MKNASIILIFAVLLILIGIWQTSRTVTYRAALEDAIKDHKLNEQQVAVRLRMHGMFCRLVTVLGIVLLATGAWLEFHH